MLTHKNTNECKYCPPCRLSADEVKQWSESLEKLLANQSKCGFTVGCLWLYLSVQTDWTDSLKSSAVGGGVWKPSSGSGAALTASACYASLRCHVISGLSAAATLQENLPRQLVTSRGRYMSKILNQAGSLEFKVLKSQLNISTTIFKTT